MATTNKNPRCGAAAPIALSLVVQYGAREPRLPRWRLRRLAEQALRAAAQDMPAIARNNRAVANPSGKSLAPAPPARAHRAELSLRLAGLAEARALNRDFRGRDYATNVLTFEYGLDPGGAARGDIVLCVPVLAREARAQNKPFLHHAAHLVIHGALHALGYDHLRKRDAQRMEALETTALARMNIPDPYA